MKVAFDLDGVLCDTLTPLKLLVSQELGHEPIHAYTTDYYGLGNLWGEHSEAASVLIKRHFTEPAVYGMGLATKTPLEAVMALGYEQVGYITRRPAAAQAVTRAWLKLHGFPVLPVLFVEGHDKKSECMAQLGATTIVEDNPREIKEVLEAGLEVLVVPTSYNKEFHHLSIPGVVNGFCR